VNKRIAKILLIFISLISLSLVPSNVLAEKGEKVTFNFVDVDLQVITKFVSELTQKNFIFDERVKGKITIIAPSKISISDAFNLFTSVLELKGFTVVPSGVDAYKIIPVSEAKQRGIKVTTDKQPVNEGYIARLISLKDISSDDALKFIQPIVSKDGYASAFGPGNLLLVIDSGVNIEKILSIMELIDRPSLTEPPEIICLKHAGADAVAKMINEGFGRRRQASRRTLSPAEAAKAIADQRLNAVVLFGDKNETREMKSLIELLDVPSPEARGMINIYFLENADATELAKVLEGLINKGSQSEQKPGTMAVSEALRGISITADKTSNALIIVASPSDYQNLAQVIRQLDKRRRQVFVEVMIAEVSIDKLLELGTKWRAAIKKDGEPVFIAGVGSVDTTTISSILTGLTGLTLGGVSNYFTIPQDFVSGATSDMKVPGITALFNLSDFKGTVNVLSTPQILTSDNKEAEIVVGENVPFVSKRERDLTTTGTVLTSIERKDVGISLKITPQITEGDYVKLDIYQEISSVKAEADSNITISIGPTTTKRSTRTSVVVKDKQTVVIGGLLQEQEQETITKVPLLGDIPLLGWLFKYKSIEKKKTNLLVFLTPHVIRETESLEQLSKDKLKNFTDEGKQFSEEGELIIEFKEGVTPETVQSIIIMQGASVTKIRKGMIYDIKLKKGQQVEDAINKFSKIPEVKKAEPNYKIKINDKD